MERNKAAIFNKLATGLFYSKTEKLFTNGM